MAMKIEMTDFKSKHNVSSIENSAALGEYVHHDVSASNYIIVNNVKLKAKYSTGDYLDNDINSPLNTFSLDQDETDGLLCALDNMYESDFEDSETLDDRKELFNENKKRINLASESELFQLYIALRENLPDLHNDDLIDEAHFEISSSSHVEYKKPEFYKEDEITKAATLK